MTPAEKIGKAPSTPLGLVSSYYILPFDLDTQHTPALIVENGFLDTYSSNTPSSFTTLPKRYISIIIPQDPVKVETYPLQIVVNLRYVDAADSNTKFHPSLLSLAVLQNEAAEADPKEFYWLSKNIQKSKLIFDVHPVNKKILTNYPNLLIASYPMLKYRYFFENRRSLACNMYYQYCYTTYSYTTGTTRECRMIIDNAAYYRASFVSQNRVDLSISTYYPSYAPDGWRRLECSGTYVIEQKPHVKDFRTSSDATINSSSAATTDITQSWAKLTESSVSSVANHHFKKDGTTVGYSEVYALKNRLSTGGMFHIVTF
jgi:hypothetical protein